ncbi:MAG: acetylornithine/succinylornithine family transaminase [Microthrixaceae bacterium]|nr:acetylornithine/succinylornithine family transaminase [Microthrixaceae bacterium]
MSTYAPPAVRFVRGEGSWLFDDTDKRYLDLLSGLAVTSLGHAHPEVAAAICAQSSRLLHVSNLFGNEHNEALASELDQLLGGSAGQPLGRVFFSNSGAEANECAIKLARKFGGRGRHVVVSAYGSFHGRTLATLHATGQPQKHEAFQPLPEGFRHAAFNDLAALAEAVDGGVAAVLLEVVQGEGGVNPVDREYLQGVAALCKERGALLMLDEVQTGLGRCGEWFAHQAYGIEPDVVTMAKALGNGMPIGACWARAEVAAAFEPGDHATTYGGQPLAAAAARKVVEVMKREDVPARANAAGAAITEGLTGRPGIASVRGMGLLLAVELDGVPAADVARLLLERGVVVNAVSPTALRLAPSLLISDDEVKLAVASIVGAIADELAN